MSLETFWIMVIMYLEVSWCTRRPDMYKEIVGVGDPRAMHNIVIMPPSTIIVDG